MLWLSTTQASFFIKACNIYYKDEQAQVWVTKDDEKTKMIFEGSEKEALEIKGAIDYAIANGEKALVL